MKLREQFDLMSCKDCDMPYCDVRCTILSENELDRFEKIAEDFAEGFWEWRSTIVINSINQYTNKEIIEIYKKQKGL